MTKRLPNGMTWKKMRDLAIGGTRAEFRRANITKAVDMTWDKAERRIDERAHANPGSIIAYYWQNITENQYKLLKRDWNRWRKSQMAWDEFKEIDDNKEVKQ